MTCKHDRIYRLENESHGGAGCPLCARERKARACPVCGSTQAHDLMTCADEAHADWMDLQATRRIITDDMAAELAGAYSPRCDF